MGFLTGRVRKPCVQALFWNNDDNKAIGGSVSHIGEATIAASMKRLQRGFVPTGQFVENVDDLDVTARRYYRTFDSKFLEAFLDFWDFAAAFLVWLTHGLAVLTACGAPSGYRGYLRLRLITGSPGFQNSGATWYYRGYFGLLMIMENSVFASSGLIFRTAW